MYKIIFEDNSIFLGGSPMNSKWNDMPDKPIKKLIYLIGNKEVFMEGFESYNHIVKHNVGLNNHLLPVHLVIIMGKFNENVFQVIFDFYKKKVIKRKCLFGQEYNEKPHPGWKKGHKTIDPKVKLYRSTS